MTNYETHTRQPDEENDHVVAIDEKREGNEAAGERFLPVLRRIGEGALYLATATVAVGGAAYVLAQTRLEISKRQAKLEKDKIMKEARPGGKLTAQEVGKRLREIDAETTDEPDGHEFNDKLGGSGK